MSVFHKKASQVVLFLIVGAIILSFMFTGFLPQFTGGPDTVAEIGDYPVKQAEYQRVLQQRIDFFTQMSGGNRLTTQQIEQFGIKQMVLRDLVQQKLSLVLADNMGVVPSKDELAEEIKKLPYFQTNNQFDVQKYKLILMQNSYTPTHFENLVANDIKSKRVFDLLDNVPLSDNYLNDVTSFKNQKKKARAIKLHKESLVKFIEVTPQEIETFLAVAENREKLKSFFQLRKAEFDQPEEVKARHILIKTDNKKNDSKAKAEIQKLATKVTPKNFASMANKHTEDPSGKGKGGSLGWFTRGKMVPEFDQIAFTMKPGTISSPVKTPFGYHLIYVENRKEAKEATFENVEKELAKEHIQKEKDQKLKKLIAELTNDLKKLLENNDTKKLEKIQKKYDFQMALNEPLNLYDAVVGPISLDQKQVTQVFSSKKKNDFFKFDSNTYVTLLYTTESSAPEKSNEQGKATKSSQQLVFSRQLRQDMFEELREDTKINTYPHLIP